MEHRAATGRTTPRVHESLEHRFAVGRTIRWARKRAGLTQDDLARRVGTPQSNVARIERGAVSPRTETVIALLEATGHRLAIERIGAEVNRHAIRRRLALEPARRTWEALGRPREAQRPTSPLRIIGILRRFGVPFVIIGDLAEVVQGVPLKLGRSVEVCRADTDEARTRLDEALAELEARAHGQDQYSTPVGRLRVVTRTEADDDHEALARTATWMLVETGLRARVAALEDLERARRARLARHSAEDDERASLIRATIAEAAAAGRGRKRPDARPS